MKINELIAKRKEIINNDQWVNWLKTSVTVQSYVPYAIKLQHATAIVTESCMKEGEIVFDTCKMYSLQLYALLTLYTDLEIDGAEWLKAYDALREYDVLDSILDRIPRREVEEFNLLINLRRDDFVANNYENHAFWKKQIDKATVFLGGFLDGSIKALVTQLEQIDETKVKTIVTKTQSMMQNFKKE